MLSEHSENIIKSDYQNLWILGKILFRILEDNWWQKTACGVLVIAR